MGNPAPAFFLILLVLLLLLLQQLPFSSGAARPGCPTHCGDLEVPFPFGIGAASSNCSLGESFVILCDTTYNPPKAFLPSSLLDYESDLHTTRTIMDYMKPPSSLEVVEIRLDVSQVKVKFPNLAVSCYNNSDNSNLSFQEYLILYLRDTAFALSENNRITAFGCDDLATIISADFRSCLSYCKDNRSNGYCPNEKNNYTGNGCCRANIPKGLTTTGAYTWDMHTNLEQKSDGPDDSGFFNPSNKKRPTKLFPCSYAFLGDIGDDEFSFPLEQLQDQNTFINENPRLKNTLLALDWRIKTGDPNCSQLNKDSTSGFACKEKSNCVDYNGTNDGYICNCLPGYTGNPYLSGPDGCKDVNECESKNSNSCKFHCINTPGSYTCSCPRWYEGDGRSHGTGCTPSKMLYVTIGLVSGLGLLLLLVTSFWSYKALQKRKNKNLRDRYFKRNGGLLLT